MEIKQLIPAQEGGYLVALPKAEEAAFTLYPVVAWAWVSGAAASRPSSLP
jgi:hypothetical protein